MLPPVTTLRIIVSQDGVHGRRNVCLGEKFNCAVCAVQLLAFFASGYSSHTEHVFHYSAKSATQLTRNELVCIKHIESISSLIRSILLD